MIKKTVTYTDYNGLKVTKDLYFNMNRVEALKLVTKYGNIEDYARSIAESGEYNKGIQMIEDILLQSYGERSEDGTSFIKNDAIRDKFKGSEAYAELFEELLTNPDSVKPFAEGIASNVKQKTATVNNDVTEV